MAVSGFDQLFGIHERALQFRAARAEVLADNLANADTPNYKARDLEFADVFNATQHRLATTQPGHLGGAGGAMPAGAPLYREPLQASLDQNTVDAQAEHARFLQNSIQYEASLRFLQGRINTLLSALRRE
ncbi:MAG: flagellar basal body rod protein FlgB [Gammaproteobacteria bacterium]|nr:flagellar basal body rod protein FlgB [Gammaproteobacteria bacterium]